MLVHTLNFRLDIKNSLYLNIWNPHFALGFYKILILKTRQKERAEKRIREILKNERRFC